MVVKIKSEKHFKGWFRKNFNKLGYSKIIRKDMGIFPDFIMLKKGKEVKVEIETLSSNFILHRHDYRKVDEVVCIKDDFKLKVPTIEVRDLDYAGGKVRVSATIDTETMNIVRVLLKKGNYRNKSHIIEDAIKLLKEKNEKKR